MPNGYDLRISNIYKALSDGEEWKPGAYYGCSADSTRKNKETNGLSSNLVYIVNEIKTYSGFHPAKGFVFSDCNLTPRNMEYLSSNLPSINHTFELVDFSYNPQLGAQGLGYFNNLLTKPGFNAIKIDLSGCNIGDAGMDILAQTVSSGRLPSLKHIDISGNGISLPKIKQFLNQISQEMFLITEKAYDNGKAVFKDAGSSSLYDMCIKSDGNETSIILENGITGISGISAGDTCPPSVKDQIRYCFIGSVTGAVKGWYTCQGKNKLVCIAKDAYFGCTLGVTTVALNACAGSADNPFSGATASTDIDWDHWGNSGASVSDRGDSSFSATGGTEIGPTTIDNDSGPMGSNFDLSQHDF